MIACVGGGSNAIGIFRGFPATRSVGSSALRRAGSTLDRAITRRPIGQGRTRASSTVPSATSCRMGRQVCGSPFGSAGLDYPGVGPEHSYLKETGRARYEGLFRSRGCPRCVPRARAARRYPPCPRKRPRPGLPHGRKKNSRGKTMIVNLSGRGDKDMEIVKTGGSHG